MDGVRPICCKISNNNGIFDTTSLRCADHCLDDKVPGGEFQWVLYILASEKDGMLADIIADVEKFAFFG